jgi:hypothetical protein
MTGRRVYRNLGLPVLARSGSTRTHQRCLLLGSNPDRICSLRAFPLLTDIVEKGLALISEQ